MGRIEAFRQKVLTCAGIIAIAGYCLWPNVALAAPKSKVVSRSFPGHQFNSLAMWKLPNSAPFHIWLTDNSGRIFCLQADTLETLWSTQLKGESLLAPVLGDFMGTGVPILAVVSHSGRVYFYGAGSGRIISSVSTGTKVSADPSVATTADGVDQLILADETGIVSGYRLEESGAPVETFSVRNSGVEATIFKVIGAITRPPCCADLDGDGNSEIIVTSDLGYVQVISPPGGGASEPVRYQARLPQNSRATTLACVGNFFPDQPNFVFGIGASLQVFAWDKTGESSDAIRMAFRSPAYGNSLGHLLAGDLNGDKMADLVSTAEGTVSARYGGRDLAGAPTFLDIASQHLVTPNGPFSSPAPVKLEKGRDALIAVDRKGVAFLWEPASAENSVQRFEGMPTVDSFPPAGDFTGTGMLSLAAWDGDEAKLSMVTLPVAVEASNEYAPAVTLGGNYARNGQFGQAWTAEWNRRQARAAEALKTAKAQPHTQANTGLKTFSRVEIIASLDPADPAAESIHRPRIDISVVKPAVAVLAAVVLVSFTTFWFARRRRK